MSRIGWPVVLVAVVASLHGIEIGRTQPIERPLPEPLDRDGVSLWSVMATRQVGTFGNRALSEAQLGQLLWAGQGILDEHHTTPSAGSLYPLTIHVVDARGVWRYAPSQHGLVQVASGDRREDLAIAALRARAVRDAAVTFVICGDVDIVTGKYGADAATRLVALEAGHAAQNMLLAATALDLAALPIGAFDTATLRDTFTFARTCTPLYLIAAGSRHDRS